MGIALFSTVMIAYGILGIVDAYIGNRVNGIYVESFLTKILMMMIVFIPFINMTMSKTEIVVYGISLMVFVGFLHLYVVGYRITIKTVSRYVIQDRLVEVLSENNIKYEIDNTIEGFVLKLEKRFSSIKLNSGVFNEQNSYVAFKGFLNYGTYRKISNDLVCKLKEDVIVKSRVRYALILEIAFFFCIIGFCIWFAFMHAIK